MDVAQPLAHDPACGDGAVSAPEPRERQDRYAYAHEPPANPQIVLERKWENRAVGERARSIDSTARGVLFEGPRPYYGVPVRGARRGHRYTYEQYVAVERDSLTRHEFLDGEIYAMAGGTEDHSAISAMVINALINAVGDRPCKVHTSDLRIYVEGAGLATFPDAAVVRGPLRQHPPRPSPLGQATVPSSTRISIMAEDAPALGRRQRLYLPSAGDSAK